MTREEAIDKLEYLVEIGDFPRCEDALKMAIEALKQEPYFWEKCPYYEPDMIFDGREEYDMGKCTYKQEPCEDAISRKFIHELGATCIATRGRNGELVAISDIDNLPPVQPKREHGEWICTKVTGEFENWNDYTCPFCKFTKRVSNGCTFTYKYCPTCGADMRGEK